MGTQAAFIGYGRFGSAFGERLLATGATVRAFDVGTPPPPKRRANSMAEALEGAEFVVIAVPVPRMEEVMQEVRPLLKSGQIVLDVGSVKSGPAQWMGRIFGEEIPWVATHPLFGPISLALGEPLRVVLCPNESHPEAVARVSALYESVGGIPVSMDPEEHDREMAQTHALTFFIAKGFMEAGVDLESPNAPPSARAIARVVEAVQRDAGHLFAALHRENPYSDEARRGLLDALARVDRALTLPVDEGGEDPALVPEILKIASSPETPQPLLEAREVIDQLDQELLDLLARRAVLSLRAAQAKADVGRGIRDAGREQELLQRRRQMADERDMDPVAVAEIFQAVLRFSRAHQARRGEKS